MGVEQHAFGAVLCGLMTRRVFVLSACGIGFAISGLQCISWAMDNLMANVVDENKVNTGCVGTECYEVWTCTGMSGATQGIRWPLAQFAGLVAFGLGLVGAKYSERHQLLWAGKAIFLLGLVYIGSAIFDVAFEKACDAYTSNVVLGFLASSSRLPPSPLGGGTQATLRQMTSYPVDKVSELTGGFNVLQWYLAVVIPWVAFCLYTAVEAEFLGDLVERGPLGLGVNYGIGQWDEIINHDAVRIQKEKLRRSKFIDDAQMPFHVNDDGQHGFLMPTGYGAAEALEGSLDLNERRPLPHFYAKSV